MVSTGRASEYDKLKDDPQKPFLKDIRNDLERINRHFSSRSAKSIKLAMIDAILKDI